MEQKIERLNMDVVRKIYPEYRNSSIEDAKLGQCYFKLSDILRTYPTYNPPCHYKRVTSSGESTNDEYTKCIDVKILLGDAAWTELSHKYETYYDWYKLHRNGDIRIVKC